MDTMYLLGVGVFAVLLLVMIIHFKMPEKLKNVTISLAFCYCIFFLMAFVSFLYDYGDRIMGVNPQHLEPFKHGVTLMQAALAVAFLIMIFYLGKEVKENFGDKEEPESNDLEEGENDKITRI